MVDEFETPALRRHRTARAFLEDMTRRGATGLSDPAVSYHLARLLKDSEAQALARLDEPGVPCPPRDAQCPTCERPVRTSWAELIRGLRTLVHTLRAYYDAEQHAADCPGGSCGCPRGTPEGAARASRTRANVERALAQPFPSTNKDNQ